MSQDMRRFSLYRDLLPSFSLQNEKFELINACSRSRGVLSFEVDDPGFDFWQDEC